MYCGVSAVLSGHVARVLTYLFMVLCLMTPTATQTSLRNLERLG